MKPGAQNYTVADAKSRNPQNQEAKLLIRPTPE